MTNGTWKRLSITNCQGKANQNRNKVVPHACENNYCKNTRKTVGRKVENGDPCTLLVETQIGAATIGNSVEISQKIKNRTTIWSSSYASWCLSKGEKKTTKPPKGRGCPWKKKAKMKKEIISRWMEMRKRPFSASLCFNHRSCPHHSPPEPKTCLKAPAWATLPSDILEVQPLSSWGICISEIFTAQPSI